MWKGDKVGYIALHSWVKWHLKKGQRCSRCGEKKKLDLANISQKYKRDLSDWEWLCRRCHMMKDGRLKRLHKRSGKYNDVPCLMCGRIFYQRKKKIKYCSQPCHYKDSRRLRDIRTMCKHGHKLSNKNRYTQKSTGYTWCMTCRNAKQERKEGE